jgi:signal transduction histidine kinase
MVVHVTGSRWVAPLRSILAGFGIFFLGSLFDLWLHQHAERLLVTIVSNALIGVGVGLLVLLYERRQRQNMIRKLEVIRMMNHHVRNSLQVISFAASVPQQEELGNNLRDAVERIEWALREVLPGQREDISDLPLHPYPKGRSLRRTASHNNSGPTTQLKA